MNHRTKAYIEATQFAYKEKLIDSIESENEIYISEEVEVKIPYVFLRECFASFAKELEGKEERKVEHAIATFTYKKANLDIVFSYLAEEKSIMVHLETEFKPFPKE